MRKGLSPTAVPLHATLKVVLGLLPAYSGAVVFTKAGTIKETRLGAFLFTIQREAALLGRQHLRCLVPQRVGRHLRNRFWWVHCFFQFGDSRKTQMIRHEISGYVRNARSGGKGEALLATPEISVPRNPTYA